MRFFGGSQDTVHSPGLHPVGSSFRGGERPQVIATMTMTLLEDWCRGMDVDIHRALLVKGIPQDCGQQEIEETLNRVLSPLGPYLILNKIFLREENAKAALIEVGEGVSLRAVPREFPGRGGVWRVVCRNPTQDAEFLKNLNEFLDAEGRTWEDVVRLLHLNNAPAPRNQNLAPGNWVEALGALLGTVMQVIVHMDAELRIQEEARAQEAEEAYALAMAASSTAGRKVKKEPARAALKMENPGSWGDVEGEGDPPKPLFRKARAKTRSRRKKHNKNSKQEPAPGKKPRDHQSGSPDSSEGPETNDGENREVSEYPRSSKRPRVKQEELAAKKPVEKCAWKSPRNARQDARSEAAGPEAAGPEVASESDQDDGPEEPPKKKAMGWASAKSPGSMRKKKKVSLGPISYVLVDVKGTKKKPLIPKKGPGLRRGMSGQRALRGSSSKETLNPTESPASTSQGIQAKPEGSPSEPRKL